ncbi:MAG: hypothetical protein HY725_22350 [Candidatus Rokubacteria bacterium]|nr:hypothetical protein [Candidatus Rokubacteria bacterium]
MLTTLLTSIQTALTASKAFVLSGLLPVTLFALASGALLARVHPGFGAWVFSADAARAPVVGVAALVWVAAAYTLSALGPTLLEVLEGKHPPVSWLSSLLYGRHWERRRALLSRYRDCAREEAEFQRKAEAWKKRLVVARRIGAARGTCTEDPATAARLHDVLRRSRRGEAVRADAVNTATRELHGLLVRNSAELEASARSAALRRAHEQLIEAIDDAWARHRFERIHLYNLIQFRYPGAPEAHEPGSSLSSLAPTAMGNVGRTIRSYALTRYGMDLDIFWTRLQKTVQASKDFHTVLQDTKILVDSLVALTWLAGLFTAGWMLVLPWIASSTIEFLVVGVLGPPLTVACYALACRSYGVFADLLRSAVDLYRLDLLKELRIPLPYGSEEEKRLWEDLGRLTGYGRPMAIIYERGGVR